MTTSLVSLERYRWDESNSTKKDRERWPKWHTSRPNISGFIYLQTTRVTHFDYCWWPSLMSLDSFRQVLSNSTNGIVIGASVCIQDLFIFFTFLSLSSLFTNYKEEKKKETKKRLWRYTKASIITPTILLEIFQWDEPNYINKGHQQWIECGTRVVWRKMSLKTFGWLLWSTPVTVCDISWCHWIHLVNIFPTVLVVSYRSFDVSSRSFSFLSLSLSLLSLL